MDKQIIVYLYNRILYSSVFEETIGTCSKMGESQKTQWWSKETKHERDHLYWFISNFKTMRQISGDRSEDIGYLEAQWLGVA